jgi:hypothetical protein
MEDSRIHNLTDQVRILTIEVEGLKRQLRRRERSSSPPSSAQPRAQETATVTTVRIGQIFFVTDNGVETWRAPNNLKLF